jgi:hypothetical protein
MSFGDNVAVVSVLVAAIVVFTVLRFSMRLVGQVAEEFGEDPARWRIMMLPFGLLGPIVARAILSRRGGGPGGYV